MVDNAEVMEAAFRGEDGALMAVSSGSALFDEQQLVPDSVSYKNSMYFDEIYHGRTAYEHLHGMPVYETTHPPMGKVFIMLGVALFGMTGFGWRVAGAAFGVALVPVLYLFVRRLTRKPAFALFAAVLAAFDTLRFTQSRIATIDIYGTFFILLAAYFMVWYCQSVLEKGWRRAFCPWRWRALPLAWARPASGPASTPARGWRCSTLAFCGSGQSRSRPASNRRWPPPSAAASSSSWRCPSSSTLQAISRTSGGRAASPSPSGGSAR